MTEQKQNWILGTLGRLICCGQVNNLAFFRTVVVIFDMNSGLFSACGRLRKYFYPVMGEGDSSNIKEFLRCESSRF